ncbi:hypothetical protein [Desulfovibrio sp. ZJ200]|uniref:DUF6848 family protein n=1 Tax=Desulfovibrio sp. ZJ200 TaxID=2709792 RepID=UPI0013EB314C|nr:hypothetical protein [Desulfovibrio sp. ZJ200]
MADVKQNESVSSRKYVPFTHSFEDPWAGESADEGQTVSLTFRFAKPTKIQLQRLQDKAVKNSSQAARNLLLDIIHADDKERFLESMEEYPGITASFASAILKGVGISADLGN